MTQRILVLNAGSSSVKFATFALRDDDPALELKGQVAGIGQGTTKLSVSDAAGKKLDWGSAASLASHEDALGLLIDRLDITARRADWLGAGHRVVHGGAAFSAPLPIDDALGNQSDLARSGDL